MPCGRQGGITKTLFLQLLILHCPLCSVILEPLECVLDSLTPKCPLFRFQQPFVPSVLSPVLSLSQARLSALCLQSSLGLPPRWNELVSASPTLASSHTSTHPRRGGPVCPHLCLVRPAFWCICVQPVAASPGTCCSPPGPPFLPKWLPCPVDSVLPSCPETCSMLGTSAAPLPSLQTSGGSTLPCWQCP